MDVRLSVDLQDGGSRTFSEDSRETCDRGNSNFTPSQHLGVHSRSLTTNVHKSALHGVPAALMMYHFGEAFSDHDTLESNYEKSFETGRLDDFISHDWVSKRSDKFLTLCVLYNGAPAVVVSCSFAVVLVFVQIYLPVPIPSQGHGDITDKYGCWCQLLCPLLFFATLFFWQHVIMLIFGVSRTVFLDKYCIDQVDEARKEAGILGLAGFLRKTQRLVVLWTPRYFTRLWCTYEVATWLHLEKPLDNVLFMPLATGKALVMGTLAATILLLIYATSMIIVGGQYYLVLSLIAGSCVLPFPVHKFRHFIRVLRNLKKQLKAFSMERADCYCCACNHVDPRNPKSTLPCDRVLVEQTVRSWFSKTHHGVQSVNSVNRMASLDSLENFDKQVQEMFGEFVVRRAGPTRMPYGYFVLYGSPFLFRCFDSLVAIRFYPVDKVIRAAVELAALSIIVFPCAFHCSFRLATTMERVFGPPKRKIVDGLLTLVTALIILMIFGGLWFSLTLTNSLQHPGPFVGAVLLDSLLTAFLFRADIMRLVRYLRDNAGWSPRRSARPSDAIKRRSSRKTSQMPDYELIDEIRIITIGPRVSRVHRLYV